MLSLVLGVGAFEVASALVVLVTEKRREFGVLLAIGGPPRLVRRTLLLAGGALGAAGVAVGIGLGVAIVLVLTALGVPHFPPDIASIYMVDTIPLRLLPGDLAVVLGSRWSRSSWPRSCPRRGPPGGSLSRCCGGSERQDHLGGAVAPRRAEAGSGAWC